MVVGGRVPAAIRHEPNRRSDLPESVTSERRLGAAGHRASGCRGPRGSG